MRLGGDKRKLLVLTWGGRNQMTGQRWGNGGRGQGMSKAKAVSHIRGGTRGGEGRRSHTLSKREKATS